VRLIQPRETHDPGAVCEVDEARKLTVELHVELALVRHKADLPAPRTVETIPGGFKVNDANAHPGAIAFANARQTPDEPRLRRSITSATRRSVARIFFRRRGKRIALAGISPTFLLSIIQPGP
jgi:hypothetical protein